MKKINNKQELTVCASMSYIFPGILLLFLETALSRILAGPLNWQKLILGFCHLCITLVQGWRQEAAILADTKTVQVCQAAL